MLYRIAILLCCLSGLAYAQEPETAPDAPTPDASQASSPSPESSSHEDLAAQPKHSPKSAKDKLAAPGHGKPAQPAAPVPGAAAETATPSLSPEQQLLNALDAALRQAARDGQRTDIGDLQAEEAKLQASLKSNGNPADVARQATQMLVMLYQTSPAPPPSSPEKPDVLDWSTKTYLLMALLVALVSPLICVAGFWWGGRAAERGVRKRFQEAGLL